MKILIIRHADPDYENNTLTKEGFLEAEALGKFYQSLKFDSIYSSPLPRALLTAEAFCKYHPNQKIIQCQWLEEFNHRIKLPYQVKENCSWDFLPSYLNENSSLLELDNYFNHPCLKERNIKDKYLEVINSFDEVLKENGYQRNGLNYSVTDSNHKTLVFVCHFGLMSVLLSHLTNIPYVSLAQGFACCPSGVTSIYTEEREKGIASFRIQTFGDYSHLTKAHLQPSFAARFCECYLDKTRHE